jgi:hypothetical protein
MSSNMIQSQIYNLNFFEETNGTNSQTNEFLSYEYKWQNSWDSKI